MIDMRVSDHAAERFKERFPELIDFGDTKARITYLMQGATLERGFLNDTRLIVWMLEKYGDFNFDYYMKSKIVFVTRGGVVITVIHRDDMGMQKRFGPSVQPRFRKKARA